MSCCGETYPGLYTLQELRHSWRASTDLGSAERRDLFRRERKAENDQCTMYTETQKYTVSTYSARILH